MHLTKFYCFVIITSRWNAVIAQMVERILGKDEVAGSIPASSSKNPAQMCGIFYFYCGAALSFSPFFYGFL